MKSPILLVDDEVNVLSALQRVFLEEPYEVLMAGSGEEGLKLLDSRRVKVVVSDERMPGMDGAEFLALARGEHPETVRIMLTGHASLDSAMKAVNCGEIYRFFTKPWQELELKMAIRSAIERYDLEAENRRLLKTIRHQAVEMKVLEKQFPGITRLEKDEQGHLVLPDISEEELAEIVAECAKEYR